MSQPDTHHPYPRLPAGERPAPQPWERDPIQPYPRRRVPFPHHLPRQQPGYPFPQPPGGADWDDDLIQV